MSIPSDPKAERDKQVVEDFYDLLPLIAQLLLDDIDGQGLDIPSFVELSDEQKRLMHIAQLLKLRKKNKHLNSAALQAIDPRRISPHVQRIIKRKKKK